MIDKKAVMKRLKQRFGDARGLLAHQILTFSMSGQPCDVTFFKRKPALNVKIDQKLSLALMYGAGLRNCRRCWTTSHCQTDRSLVSAKYG